MIYTVIYQYLQITQYGFDFCLQQWKDYYQFIEEMLRSSCDFKYRSVKYSISASSLHNHKMHSNLDDDRFRLSYSKENMIGVRPQTSKMLKSSQPKKLWNNCTSSSSYKLRFVANSSHVEQQAGEHQGNEGETQKQQQIKVLKCSYITPYEDYLCNLEEIFQPLPLSLAADKSHTKQIKIQLESIREKAENQLKLTQQYFCNQINRLRSLMGITFKNHSRQTINSRQSIQQLHESVNVLQDKCFMMSEQLIRLDDNYNS